MYGDIPSRGWDDYYPLGTWNGDPRAPWNEPEPGDGHTCRECAYCTEIKCLDGSTEQVCGFEIEYGGELERIDECNDACGGFDEFGRMFSSNDPCGDSCADCRYAVDCTINGSPMTICFSDTSQIIEVDKVNGRCDDYN